MKEATASALMSECPGDGNNIQRFKICETYGIFKSFGVYTVKTLELKFFN